MHRLTTVVLIGMALLAVMSLAAAQELTATVQPTGMITISRGDVELAMIELNAHGPNWKHASQALATAEVADLEGGGLQAVGTLPVEGADGGALQFTQKLTPTAEGLRLDYDVTVTKTMRLNGLQVSILLPVEVYAGKEIIVTHPEAEARTATLPEEQSEDNTQVFGGEGARIEVAKDAPEAVCVEARAATDLLIQDLRKWEHPQFEIRFPAIMQEGGREVAADDKFHLDLLLTFAGPIKIAAAD